MGLILDSSVVIAAERRGDTVEKLIEQVVRAAGDQDAALASVGLTELVHGIYRAQTPEMRLRRQSFIGELLRDLTVYPYTKETAMLAGKIDGEQQAHLDLPRKLRVLPSGQFQYDAGAIKAMTAMTTEVAPITPARI